MLDTSLIADKTIINAHGDSAAMSLDGLSNRVLLIALNITGIVEQESIELSVLGSADGQTWSAKALLTFAQQFYEGETPLLLDLSEHSEVKFIRAHWQVNRWGRGQEQPMFELGVRVKEVPQEMLTPR
jgi:hypothetical protein